MGSRTSLTKESTQHNCPKQTSEESSLGHREFCTGTQSREKWHQTAARNIVTCHLHHHLPGTGGMIQKKMKMKNLAKTTSPQTNAREMIPHNKRVLENRPPEKETLTPQILPPKRVRDSRHLNGDKAADADTKTPYVTIQTSPSTCQKSRHPRKYKQIKMLCQ